MKNYINLFPYPLIKLVEKIDMIALSDGNCIMDEEKKLNDKMLLIFMNKYKIYKHREYKYGIEIKNM